MFVDLGATIGRLIGCLDMVAGFLECVERLLKNQFVSYYFLILVEFKGGVKCVINL